MPNLYTYTLRFPDLPNQDEAALAAATARHLDCRSTMVDVASSDMLDLLPRFAAAVDPPSVDGLNTWLISQAAASDVKTVLSGIGGDEWFAGYSVTRRMLRYSTTLLGRAIGGCTSGRGVADSDSEGRCASGSTIWPRSTLDTWIHAHTVFQYDVARKMLGIDSPESSQRRSSPACSPK